MSRVRGRLGAVLDALPVREPDDVAAWQMELLPLVRLVWVPACRAGGARVLVLVVLVLVVLVLVPVPILGCTGKLEANSGMLFCFVCASLLQQRCPKLCCSLHTCVSMWLYL